MMICYVVKFSESINLLVMVLVISISNNSIIVLSICALYSPKCSVPTPCSGFLGPKAVYEKKKYFKKKENY